MVWAAVSAIFRLQHVFVAVERFFPVVTPPSDMSLPVFIAKFPLLMVFCRPTFRLCSDLFRHIGGPMGRLRSATPRDRARRVCREVCCSGQKPGCRGPCTALLRPLKKQCRLNRLTGQGVLAEEGCDGQAINRGSAARSAGMAATRWCHGPGRGEQGPMKKPSSGGLLSQQPESGA